jgi:hypothetical protein
MNIIDPFLLGAALFRQLLNGGLLIASQQVTMSTYLFDISKCLCVSSRVTFFGLK